LFLYLVMYFTINKQGSTLKIRLVPAAVPLRFRSLCRVALAPHTWQSAPREKARGKYFNMPFEITKRKRLSERYLTIRKPSLGFLVPAVSL